MNTILTTGDETEWRARLPLSKSVFGSVEYARIFEEQSGYLARLFVVERGDSYIVYPFFLRPLRDLPFTDNYLGAYRDTLSPEYTGPLLFGPPSQSLNTEFRDKWRSLCQTERIIAEFAHLHLWDCHYNCLEAAAIHLNREVVYVDLTWSPERLWSDSYNRACRKNINRARRENVQVITAQTSRDIEEFYRIYVNTMDRNQASSKYYFSLDYFLNFFHLIPQHARFALALYQEKIVAGTLYLHDNDSVYSYLGGADHDFQHVRPTNAIVHETISWAQSQDKRRLILGAGYRPDDGIFRFKASFSPLRAKFQVYKSIHQENIYLSLCDQWVKHFHQQIRSETYFPAYREIPSSVAELQEID